MRARAHCVAAYAGLVLQELKWEVCWRLYPEVVKLPALGRAHIGITHVQLNVLKLFHARMTGANQALLGLNAGKHMRDMCVCTELHCWRENVSFVFAVRIRALNWVDVI